MKKINTILIGRGTSAVNCLDLFVKHNVSPKCVIIDPNDNGIDTWSKSLLKRSLELGYKQNNSLFDYKDLNSCDFLKKINTFFPDVDYIFSIQPKILFKKQFISMAKKHVINMHFSPLPKLRGVDTCSWAIVDRLKNMGVTLHLINIYGIDNGPIIAQCTFPIRKNDTAWTLFQKCIDHGTELLKKNISAILTNNFKTINQDESKATYHGKGDFDFNNLNIKTSMSVNQAYIFIRSRIFPPIQLPYIKKNNKKVKIIAIQKIYNNFEYKKTHVRYPYMRVKFKNGAIDLKLAN